MADEGELGDCTLRSDESQAGSREDGDTCVKSRFAQSKSSAGPFMGHESAYYLDRPDRCLGQDNASSQDLTSSGRVASQSQNGDCAPSRGATNIQDTLDGINVLVGQLRNHNYHDARRVNPGQAKPRVMPDLFDGRVPWSQYKAHFNTVAELNGWNDHEKAQFMAVSLRGEACQVVELLEPDARRNYRHLVDAMDRRFHPNQSESLYRT